MFVSIAKAVLIPGSVPFLVMALAAGVTLLYVGESGRVWARRWLTVLALAYWTMSVPLGADALTAMMSLGYTPLVSALSAAGADTIVVLDGGTSQTRTGAGRIDAISDVSALRALEAVRVYRLLDQPWIVVTAGSYDPQQPGHPEGAAITRELVNAGVPPGRIILDTRSRNTREHAINLRPILRERGSTRVVLVTSPTHIRRSVLAFRAVGLDVIASPAAAHTMDTIDRNWSWMSCWPRTEALKVSEDALRDAMALVEYWARGWLSARRIGKEQQP